MFLVWVSSFIYSILLPNAFYFCLYLLVIFTTSCSDVRDLLVQQRKQTGDGVKPVLQLAPVPVSAVTFVPDDYQVSVYFDGTIDRGDVLKVMTGLERDVGNCGSLLKEVGRLGQRQPPTLIRCGTTRPRRKMKLPQSRSQVCATSEFDICANTARSGGGDAAQRFGGMDQSSVSPGT